MVSERLPTRLLDVSHSDGKIRLITSSNDQKIKDLKNSGGSVRYAALSYCWGTYPSFTTTPASFKDQCEGFLIEEMPPTLQDAVQVTRDLGCNYLWIDALCILQGDSKQAREDWERESATMNSVYGNAYFTIGSIFHMYKREMNNKSKNEKVTAQVSMLLPDVEFKDLPINARGWSHQEWLLSSRLLVFGANGPFFYCTSESEREKSGFRPSNRNPIGHKILKYRLPLEEESAQPAHWFLILMAYSCRNLTNPRDKLPAIAGVARQWDVLTKGDGGEYLAGLWRKYLLPGLLWRRERDFFLLVTPNVDICVHRERAPSWSWASIDCNTMWAFTFEFREENYRARIIDCTTKLATDDPFGMVSEGRLVISGPTTSAYLHKDDEDDLYDACSSPDNSSPKKVATIWLDDKNIVTEENLKGDGLVYCLCLYKWKPDAVGLVLMEDDDSGNFRRIGVFYGHDPYKEEEPGVVDFFQQPEREFVIV
ncbi:hypothetical protein CEP52_008178 [Fusarium oligoseptatum]|uniref:Heterokaryon incompatibility domain-containing protein n=1 Tax=Fusarium oligoseptatum TaxID=2604345 RepID=A0A428TJA1_9HYPO|nr:hypothetical protein CEP52_008178 [Fusarium oligoseptatum]